MAGITSYGAYIPYYRLPRAVINKAWGRGGGRGELAIANFDEDPVSMSVAAGMDCLRGIDPKTVDGLFLGTTCAPYKERLNSTIAATALDINPESRNIDFANCIRAGTIAMLAALDVINAGSAKSIMVTASDIRLGAASGENEQSFGDGAAALLMGNESVIAEVEGTYSMADDLSDNWRADEDKYVRSWEDRFGLDMGYRRMPAEAAAGVLKKLNLEMKDITKACFYGPSSRRHGELARILKLEEGQVQESLLDTVGNTGSALPLMILVAALEEAKAGDRILLISYGNGSDAIVFKVTAAIEKVRDRRGIKKHLEIKRTLENYEKLLRWRDMLYLEPAARPPKDPTSMSSVYREYRTALPLYGFKCNNCGTPQMFMNASITRAHICLKCHAKDDFTPYRFADKRGQVFTFSHDYLALSADPPNTLTVIDFDGGGRGEFEMTDRDPDECQVGMDVELTFRKIYYDKGIHNYFWKCKPLRD